MQDLRVLLLEDDPAVRLFLQMALEPLSLNLVPCATLAQARQALADPDVRLMLTDSPRRFWPGAAAMGE